MAEKLSLEEAMDQVQESRDIADQIINHPAIACTSLQIFTFEVERDIAYQIISQRIRDELEKNPDSKDYTLLKSLGEYFTKKLKRLTQ